jgi:hypothetical protein
MRDEVRKEVSQNSEQRQTADAVAGKNPCSAAFMLPDGGSGGRGLVTTGRRDDRGPIFHARSLQRKDRGASTLCVTPASHRGETRLSGLDFTPNWSLRERKIDRNHRIIKQNNCHDMTIDPFPCNRPASPGLTPPGLRGLSLFPAPRSCCPPVSTRTTPTWDNG